MSLKSKETLPLTARSGGVAFSGMVFLYVLISFFGQSVLSALSVDGGVIYVAICATFPALAIVATLIISRVVANRKTTCLLGVEKCKVKYFGFAVLLAGGMFFGLGFVNSLFVDLLTGWDVVLTEREVPLYSLGHFILFVGLLGILPAVFEEIFFRGYMMKSLSETRLVEAVLFVSICFSLYHCSVTQLIYQFIYGVGLCLLAYLAKSSLPCILAHFLNNFGVLLFTYLQVEINLYNPVCIILGLIGLTVFGVLVGVDLKKIKSNGLTAEEKSVEAKDFWWPIGIFGVIICLVIIVSNLFLAV